MAVLKQSRSRAMLRDAIVLDLGDVTRQAEKIRQAAHEAAERTLTEAKQQADAIRDDARNAAVEAGHKEGYEAGLTEGREAGRAEALEQMKQQLEGLQRGWMQAATQWDAQQQAMYHECQQVMLDMALLMAQKLLHRVIDVDRNVVVGQVAAALRHVTRPFDVKVAIHPEDRPVLEESLPQLLQAFDHLKHVELVDDKGVGRGGCVVRYGQGMIDASIEKQLDRVIELIAPKSSDEHASTQPDESDK